MFLLRLCNFLIQSIKFYGLTFLVPSWIMFLVHKLKNVEDICLDNIMIHIFIFVASYNVRTFC